MQTFTDIHGRKWTVIVTIGTVKRVKARLDIDMLDTNSFLIQAQDILALCDILYVVCQDEADKYGITDEQFAASFSGLTIREASDAFMEAYMAFFPDPELTARLRVVADKNKALREKAIALVESKTPKMIQRMNEEMEVFLDELAATIDNDTAPGKPSTKPPPSSASTRRRSRSTK